MFGAGARSAPPVSHDPRVAIEPFAAAPEIVHPIAAVCTRDGKLLVIESHTHFRPAGYQGPKADRIRLIEDADGNGKADRFSTFFEGTTFSMDLAVHPSGDIYLATRNEILKLIDLDHDGKAEKSERIAHLETKGDYPHNGLSGLSFDFAGNLTFGLGENLGAAYALIGADGARLSGEGDGGGIFTCSAEGKNLRRIATGFWNPFGTARDFYGRLFAVDNDPDSSPPCRLLHIIEDGDYGYQFRYGRSGKHPFQAWNGQLPGTLGMVCGTGESPCEILFYESLGLPDDYRGDILVSAWSDHRVERYRLKPQGSTFSADRVPFIQGDGDFRPVGIAVAPDGSLYVTDWVLRDYNLHGKGAIWKVKARQRVRPERPVPTDPLLSRDRETREAAARRYAAGDVQGIAKLEQGLTNLDARIRATCLMALAGVRDFDLKTVVAREIDPGMQSLAVRLMADRGDDVGRLSLTCAEARRERIAGLKPEADARELLTLLGSDDPFVRTTARSVVAKTPHLPAQPAPEGRARPEWLLALRESNSPQARAKIPQFLQDPIRDVRFLAAKWVADEKLITYRGEIAKAAASRDIDTPLALAYATASARLDDKPVTQEAVADACVGRVFDARLTAAERAGSLRLIPANHRGINVDSLAKLITSGDETLGLEALRALADRPGGAKRLVLREVLRDESRTDLARAWAIVALAELAAEEKPLLLSIAQGKSETLRDEALRALSGVELTSEERALLEKIAGDHPGSAALVHRALKRPGWSEPRPEASDVDGWLASLSGQGDAAAGARIFANLRLANCARCHVAQGRGGSIGPDLSAIGVTDRKAILESILIPARSVGPAYQVWKIAATNGVVREGVLVHTDLDRDDYADNSGARFTVDTREIEEIKPVATSIMPDKLTDALTIGEVRDLLAFLCSCK